MNILVMFCRGTKWDPHVQPSHCRYDVKIDIWSVAELAMLCRGHACQTPETKASSAEAQTMHILKRMFAMLGRPSIPIVDRLYWSIPGKPAIEGLGLREPYKSDFPPAAQMFAYDPSVRLDATQALRSLRLQS